MNIPKLAAYLEEAGDDPASSCRNLLSHNIPYVALRNLWSNNIAKLDDKACQNLMRVLKDHEMSVIMLCSDLGKINANQLPSITDQEITRTFNIAEYFKCNNLRIFVGEHQPNTNKIVEEWMDRITQKAISYNVTPLLEITHGSSLFKTIDAVQMLTKFPRWKLLYDPAQLIIKQVLDPFIKYWTLLKKYTKIIDVHDFKIGKGHKPVGYGDTNIVKTINDSINNDQTIWHVLEPALGNKYGSALTRSQTFALAYEALRSI